MRLGKWKLTNGQLDISEDGFLSLFGEDGSEKEDVKLPEGEVGQKIHSQFKEGKELSKIV